MKFVPVLLVPACFAFSGCPSPKWNLMSEEELVSEGEGVFHTVKKGETLYRICKTYRVDLQTVAEDNDIDDPAKLNVGDRLFISGAHKVLEVQTAVASSPPPPPPKHPQPTKPPTTAPVKPPMGTQVAVKDEERPSTYKGQFIWPVKGVLVSRFGVRGGSKHQGIDISAPQGTAVLAAASGKVLYSDNKLRGYGNLILVSHSDGLITVYAHNRENKVKEGETVSKGQQIAEVGATGNAEAPHLHFEVREGAKARNPLFFLP